MGTGPTLSIILLTVVHFAAVALLIWVLAGSEVRNLFRLGSDDDGGVARDRGSSGPSGDGGEALPLPDAAPAAVRLRDGGRIADRYPRRPRRPDHAPLPAEPVRERDPA